MTLLEELQARILAKSDFGSRAKRILPPIQPESLRSSEGSSGLLPDTAETRAAKELGSSELSEPIQYL